MNTSSTSNFTCITISLRRISSSIEITEAIDVALRRPFTELPIAGRMMRVACGRSTLRRASMRDRPSALAASVWPVGMARKPPRMISAM